MIDFDYSKTSKTKTNHTTAAAAATSERARERERERPLAAVSPAPNCLISLSSAPSELCLSLLARARNRTPDDDRLLRNQLVIPRRCSICVRPLPNAVVAGADAKATATSSTTT